MTAPRAGQFRVELPDGLVIERLPIGLANGHWHLSFVCSGVDFLGGAPARFTQFAAEFRSKVRVTAVGGDLDYRGGGGSGGDDEQSVQMRLRDNGMTAIEISYLSEGAVIAHELIDLS